MSDSDERNPFDLPRSPQSSLESVEALTKRLPHLKDILLGPPDQIFANVQKLSSLSEVERKNITKERLSPYMKISKALVEQLNKVTTWNIDHEKLYQSLQSITEFIPIDLNYIYKNSILNKIENGLTFIELLGKIQRPLQSSRPRRGRPMGSTFNNVLQNCYKVIKSDAYKEDPDFTLYNKRYDCLNNQQKLKYKIKLLRHLIAIPSLPNDPNLGPLNPNHLLHYSNKQKKEEQLADVQRLYHQLETTEYEWFLEEMLNIDCPKTTEYKKIISSLGFKQRQGEQGEIYLSHSPKIRPNLITKDLLLKCLKDQRQSQPNLLSEGSILKANGKVYLKYDITQLLEVSLEQIVPMKDIRRRQNPVLDLLKKHISSMIEKTYLLMQQANEQRQILIYESFNTFKSIPVDQLLIVAQFCTKIIAQTIQFGEYIQKISMISEILLKPQLVIHLNMALAIMGRTNNQEKCKSLIFLRICRILEKLVMMNQDKILIMKNQDFLNLFVQNVNQITSDLSLKTVPVKLQSFLITYMLKLLQFGLDISKLNLTRIYELEFNNLGSLGSKLNHHQMMRNRFGPSDSDMEDFLINDLINAPEQLQPKDKLEQFILVFPGCISYFSEKLQASATSIQLQLAGLDVFDTVPSPTLQSLLKLFVSEKIPSNQNLNIVFKNIFNQHPSLFVNASSSINFNALKKKLDVKEQEISASLLATLTRLRQNLAVQSLSPEQLCENVTTSKKQVIELANSISHLNLLLKMRQVSSGFPFIKQLLEISLIMQKIESICLNKIVKYQAQYSEQKLNEIKKYYSEVGDKKILYFKIQLVSRLLFETCWNIFEKLDIAHLNILLKELRIYFEAMKNLTDRNLLLRLLKKTYRNIGHINKKTKINLNIQLYNHNKDIIIEVLGLIYKQNSLNRKIQERTTVMGSSYLRFIDSCKKQGKNPAQQFDIIIIPHIKSSVKELISFIFYEILQKQIILNNKKYSGAQNTSRVVRSIVCDVFKRIGMTFDKDCVYFYKYMFHRPSIRTRKALGEEAEIQIQLEIQEPADPLKLVSKEQKQKMTSEAYIGILDKIYEHRYYEQNLNDLQFLFFIIIERLAQVYKITNQEQKMLKAIIEEINEIGDKKEFDQKILKIQCSWIDGIFSKVKNFKIEDVMSVSFIKKYLKIITFMLNTPVQYKESIPDFIIILQKFIPKDYAQNRSELIGFAMNLLQLISKVVAYSIEIKKVNAAVIESIASILIHSKCSEFNHHIQQFLSILTKQGVNIGPLISNLIEKQLKLPLMEADIKGLFLKQSQNLVDESQDKISIKLNTFINIFKFKYGEEITAFGNLTSKFISKSIKSDDKNETVYLCYEKTNSFFYSELLKRNFNQFEPSDSIKVIIKDLLQFGSKNDLKVVLDSLRDVLYYSPLMIPYVMLHPIETSNGKLQFIDYLVTEVSSKRIQAISNFLLFACLDYSCMAKLQDRTIFFSQYLCYKIIKQIIKLGINKYTLNLIYYLSQLKKFAYLCKIKLDQTSKASLSDVLVKHLAANREGYHYKNCDNSLVYFILAIVFKQDGIDNLKKCFVPKEKKQSQREYKIINECLIPFNVFFRNLKDGKLEQREDNISFTGNVITPFYPEMYENVFMDEDYKWITKSNYSIQMPVAEREIFIFQADSLESHHLKSLASVKNTKKYESSKRQLLTDLNRRHRVILSRINEVYFKGENEVGDRERDDREQMRERLFQRRQRDRLREGGYVRHKRNAHRRDRRNQPFKSRYAQEDFDNREDREPQEKKTLEKQFEQSLNVVPSEQTIREEGSPLKFDDIKTGEQELELLLTKINQKMFLLGKDSLNIRQLKGQTFAEKKSFLELKDIQTDFDYHKIALWPHQFEQYCMQHAHKFQKLDAERKQSIRIAEQAMYTRNITRRYSSDSIGYIIDTIDVNHQHLNISKTLSLSRSDSLNSQRENMENEQEEAFLFESNQLPIRAFSEIQETTLYEMLLSFYYVCDALPNKSFMPFLQNKKSQPKLITTLLHLMKDPFSSEQFPKCIYSHTIGEISWKMVAITQGNFKEERQMFVERVLTVFESVKNYSYHQDDNFLLTEISNEGLFGINYEPISQATGKNVYIPIFQILQYGFSIQAKSIAIQLLKGVKQLPEREIDQIVQLLQKSEEVVETDEPQHDFMMGRVFAMPKKGSNSFPYENLKEISKNKVFQTKFRQVYIFGKKDPTPALLTHLIQSGIYTSEELKIFHLNFLASGQKDRQTLEFLNKVIQVYTDQDLKDANWIKDYRQTIAKVIDFLNFKQVQLNKQPISRILKLKNQLGLEIKKAIFKKEMDERKRNTNFDWEEFENNKVIVKRKKGIFQSTFQELRNNPDNFWLSQFRVKFISENGLPESGVGDGVRRQWFTLLSKTMVNLNYALFKRNQKNQYFFNRQSSLNPRHLQYFEFIGKLFGFSLTQSSVFVSPSFSIMLYKLILGEDITFDDIEEYFDPAQVTSMIKLKKEIKTKEEFVATELEVTFIYEDKKLLSTLPQKMQIGKEYYVKKQGEKRKIELLKKTSEVIKELQSDSEQQQKNLLPQRVNVLKVNEIIELKPGGSDILVTFDNLQEYIDLSKKKIYELQVESIRKQFDAFMSGFKRIVNPKLIAKFTAKELKLLAQGVNTISIEDLKKYTNSNIDQAVAALMWSTLEDLSNEDRALFLWNWTGVDKMPAEGARIMRLKISSTKGPNFIAHTCFNSLEVPNCKTKHEMETAVTIVLNNVKTGSAIIED